MDQVRVPLVLLSGPRDASRGGLEVAVVGRLLLRAMDWTLRAVDVEGHAPAERPRGIVLHQVSIEA
jgi:hypothetical protein